MLVLQLLYVSAWGNRECQSKFNVLFLECMGPAKSIWISSLGSVWFGVPKLVFGRIGSKFLPFSIQCLQFCACATISLCMCGYHTNLAGASIFACPGCLLRMVCNTSGCYFAGITNLLSNKRQPVGVTDKYLGIL